LAFEDWKRWGLSPARPEQDPSRDNRLPDLVGPEESDEELAIEKRWMLLARMDTERFEFFYEKYYARIFRFFYQRTLDRDVAQDLTGETFVRALNRLWSFRWQGVTFGGWLYRIALNQLQKYRRTRALWRTVPQGDNIIGQDALADDQADPLDRLIHSQQRHRLLVQLERLEEVVRQDVTMHYLDGLTFREIAAIRGAPAGTVRSRVSRGVAQLRKLMGDQP